LNSEFSVVVPESNPGLASDLATNIGTMTSGGGSKWYQSLEDSCKASGGCPFGITGVTASVVSVTHVAGIGGGGGGGGGGAIQSSCETRCIAFIVIGIVVTITVIIAALLIYKHRADADRQGTGQTAKPDPAGEENRERAENPLA